MILFYSDYLEGAHPRILERLVETNMMQTPGYGEDPVCEEAKDIVRSVCRAGNADVHFLVGGTQTNATVISSVLKPYQGVLCASSGHINVHETGAVEGTGHKILTVPVENDGKLLPEDIIDVCEKHTDCHMVHPSVVYISDTTETGAVYTRNEIKAIRDVCTRYGLLLFVDGARLGSALTASKNDVTLRDLAWMTDAFTIGGTKNGALAGEAVVISNDRVKKDFRYYIKHRGAMNAKGFVIGMQFETLFTDRLYFRLAENANQMAEKVRDIIVKAKYAFYSYPESNQIFVVLPNDVMNKLARDFAFEVWGAADENSTVIRFVTSWATRQEHIDALEKALLK